MFFKQLGNLLFSCGTRNHRRNRFGNRPQGCAGIGDSDVLQVNLGAQATLGINQKDTARSLQLALAENFQRL